LSTETTVATAVDVTGWMQEIAAAVAAQADHLTQLDSAIGDGDHGVNMTRGFRAVQEALGAQDGAQPPGNLLIAAGKTLVSTVGGASGPLWGTALRRAGRAARHAPALDGPALAAALEAALDGVTELGAAEEGDKTMVDALAPAVRELRARIDGGEELGGAIAAAAAAAEEGARATVPLQARKGRASDLGERAIGHEDPGAASTALILAALARAVDPPG
jgi:phosphoenolpyruvate---glycerone phosphotransferase subunit DhaL